MSNDIAENSNPLIRSSDPGIVQERKNEAVVSSVTFAKYLERDHKNVLASIRDILAPEISRLELKPSTYKDSRGKQQPMYYLTERQALIAAPFIGGERAQEVQRDLVDAFQYFRDYAAKDKTKRDNSKALTDAITKARAKLGKDTDFRHFVNEQNLCNWTLTGTFGPLEGDDLTAEGLKLLADIRGINTALILLGLDYQTRKDRLSEYRAENILALEVDHG